MDRSSRPESDNGDDHKHPWLVRIRGVCGKAGAVVADPEELVVEDSLAPGCGRCVVLRLEGLVVCAHWRVPDDEHLPISVAEGCDDWCWTSTASRCLSTKEVDRTPTSLDARVPVNGAGGVYGIRPAQVRTQDEFDGTDVPEGGPVAGSEFVKVDEASGC
jgi:hypothetical protein